MEICLISLLRHPELDFATLAEPLTIEPIGIALPADDTLLANLVGNYLAAIETTGLLEGLYEVWYTDPAWLILLP
jgi:polar amino acid transport system substrate-binding protein